MKLRPRIGIVILAICLLISGEVAAVTRLTCYSEFSATTSKVLYEEAKADSTVSPHCHGNHLKNDSSLTDSGTSMTDHCPCKNCHCPSCHCFYVSIAITTMGVIPLVCLHGVQPYHANPYPLLKAHTEERFRPPITT